LLWSEVTPHCSKSFTDTVVSFDDPHKPLPYTHAHKILVDSRAIRHVNPDVQSAHSWDIGHLCFAVLETGKENPIWKRFTYSLWQNISAYNVHTCPSLWRTVRTL
jgi:hypothetical protein